MQSGIGDFTFKPPLTRKTELKVGCSLKSQQTLTFLAFLFLSDVFEPNKLRFKESLESPLTEVLAVYLDGLRLAATK